MRFINFALKDSSKTSILESNENVSLKCALESIILLKNDNNALPLKSKKIDLFGNGVRHTIKGGLGSGEVNELDVKSIYDAFKELGFEICSDSWLDRYDKLYNEELIRYKKSIHKAIYHFDFINFMGLRLNFISGDLLDDLDCDSLTCIYVISRFSGEGKDITKEEYSISSTELNNLKFCKEKYEKTILILNVGGFFDLSFLDEVDIDSVIYMGNLGKMGGYALGHILIDTSPSGKLPFTYPNKYEDIPFSNEFSYNSKSIDSNYKEGIYVGYRYYDTFKKNIRYPFGYGITYSNFSCDNFKYEVNNSLINIKFNVKNIGNFQAKNTILLFLEAPKKQGEEKSLIGFYKTTNLKPNEKENANIQFDLFDFAYTNELHHMLSKGTYIIRYGFDSKETYPIFKFKLDEDFVLYDVIKMSDFKDELVKEINPSDLDIEQIKLDLNYKKENYTLNNNFDNLSNLSLRDRINLCVGSGLLPKTNFVCVSGCAGYTTPFVKNMPSLAMADGPAGIRISPKVKIKKDGKTQAIIPSMDIYNYLPKIFKYFKYAKDNKKNTHIGYLQTTSFPTGISLASTFNVEIINEVGIAISKELNCYGISFYLAPAINIIKNPIGGRSFEYYSEDPYLAGIVAAALIRGVENTKGQYAVLKHYACNNLEFRRNEISANVSDNALRVIYLKAFQIAIKYSNPSVIMSCYNKVNHKYVSNDSKMLNDILRLEFGFNGFVMTDWLATGNKFGSHVEAIKAGNDLIMPGNRKAFNQILRAYKRRKITKDELNRAASNVLKIIIKTDIYKKYKK